MLCDEEHRRNANARDSSTSSQNQDRPALVRGMEGDQVWRGRSSRYLPQITSLGLGPIASLLGGHIAPGPYTKAIRAERYLRLFLKA